MMKMLSEQQNETFDGVSTFRLNFESNSEMKVLFPRSGKKPT